MSELAPAAEPASAAIDWQRMAEPQADQYDSEVTLHLARTTTAPLRPRSYVRREVAGEAVLFDGRVAVRPAGQRSLGANYVDAPTNHENLARAESYVRHWPAAFEQLRRLVDTIHPLSDTTIEPAQLPVYLGSSSHSFEDEFGLIYATVDNPLCLAQALVHELAHHKLRALGVSLEGARRLITNDPQQLYTSPIRKDKKRPMTAVFHSEYSFIYVTCLDVHMFAAETDPETRERILMLLARNVPRMESGLAEIDRHIQTDAEGAIFVPAFRAWAASVLRRGSQLLDENGYGMPVLT